MRRIPRGLITSMRRSYLHLHGVGWKRSRRTTWWLLGHETSCASGVQAVLQLNCRKVPFKMCPQIRSFQFPCMVHMLLCRPAIISYSAAYVLLARQQELARFGTLHSWLRTQYLHLRLDSPRPHFHHYCRYVAPVQDH